MKTRTAVLSVVGALLVGTSYVQAATIVASPTGLSAPDQTITFDEHVLHRIIEITLQNMPTLSLKRRAWFEPLDQLLERYEELIAKHYSVDMYYVPFSDYGIVITRTDPNVPKHAGLTMFFLSMKSPGVEVRPIKQISGGANFNEVFFTDVRIPDSQRLGKVGEGWKAALTTLMNERLAVGLPSGGLDVDELMELARDTDLEDGPAIKNQQVRAKIADWYVQQQGLKLTRYRTLTALSKGQTPGPESSIIKIVAAPKMQDMGAFAMELMGPAGIMKEEVPHAAGFQAQWVGGAGFRIAGGTDEILRNIVAERVLGLPQDVRVDKDVPFNQLGKTG